LAPVTAFSLGGRFRVVYDWRGDRRFHVISLPLRFSANFASLPAQPAPPSACSSITSGAGGTYGPPKWFLPFFDTSACNIENSPIFQYVTGSQTLFGIVTTGGSSFTPTVNLEVQGSASVGGQNIQIRATNNNTANSTPSVAYVSAAAASDTGIVTILESSAQIDSMGGVTGKGLFGTYTDFPLGLITNQGGSNTAAMWITSNDVGIGTTSPVSGQGLTIAPPASTGTPTLLSVTGPAHTGLTNEANDVYFGLNRTVTFSSVPSTNEQRAVYVRAPTYSLPGALTTAATVDISGAPGNGSGSNPIASSYGLNIEAGAVAGDITNAYGFSASAPSGATNNYAAQFTGPVSGAVGNPSGVLPANGSTYPGTVFHMDGVKYTSLDSIFTTSPGLQNNLAVTIYDDCPGGTETLNNDPFHPSNGLTYHITIYSAPCLYIVNVPIVLKTGDWWYGAPGGYYTGPNTFPRVVAGTVWRAGPSFPPALPAPTAPVSAASYTGPGGSLTQGDYYWVGWTAVGGTTGNLIGESPLISTTYSYLSYQQLGELTSATNRKILVNIPSSIGGATEYCVYVVQNNASGFPSPSPPTAPQFVGCAAAGGQVTISSYPSGNNPPPGSNHTQYLFTLGAPINTSPAQISNRLGINGGVVDCFGIAGAVANTTAQDPPAGIFNLSFENCSGDSTTNTGDSGILLEGFDGFLGANGSSVASIFALPSSCQASGSGGCTGGINTAPSIGTISSVTTGSASVYAASGTTFPTSWNSSTPFISINAPTDGLDSCGGPCQVSSVASGGGSLTLASNWTAPTRSNVGFAVARVTDLFPTYGIHDDAVAQLKKIDGLDYGADNCGTSTTSCTTAAAVRLDPSQSYPISATKVSVHDVHAEGLANQCSVHGPTTAAVDDNQVPATIQGVHSSCQVPYSVQLELGTTAVDLSNLIPYSDPVTHAGIPAINDQSVSASSPYTSPAGQPIGEYDIEQTGTVLNPAGTSALFNSVTVGVGVTSASVSGETGTGSTPGTSVAFEPGISAGSVLDGYAQYDGAAIANGSSNSISVGTILCQSTTANTLIPCPTAAIAGWIGFATVATSTTTHEVVIRDGEVANALFDTATLNIGDQVCMPKTSTGLVTDSSTVCNAGKGVGVVRGNLMHSGSSGASADIWIARY
jgi:hypothetical protein